MTIREIEALSGMTRANIRFYESEGLLTPNRMENGYRDYTKSDLETLIRSGCCARWGLGSTRSGSSRQGRRRWAKRLKAACLRCRKNSGRSCVQRRSHERCCGRTRTMRR